MSLQTATHRDNKKKCGWMVAGIILLATLALGWYTYQRVLSHPLSEDAVIQADIVHISTPVPGRVLNFHVREGSRVKRGDLLFRLDPTVYQLRVEQAEAELQMAEAGLEARRRTIRAETANAVVADEQIERARHNLQLAERTRQRLQPLAAKGYVTKQQLDDAVTLEHDARVSLNQALSQAQAAEHLVGATEAEQAMVQVSRSALAIARNSLADTEVYAPQDGLVVGLAVSEGEYAAPDQSLFTLINTNSWHATAFYRETQLANIEQGACASVYLLGSPDTLIKGRVENIGWGIVSPEMVSLPRSLPYVQKSLNWVRVAQRFPVRIALEPGHENLLRMGASADVVIGHGSDC